MHGSGFESLALRHTKKGPNGALFGMAESEDLIQTLRFEKLAPRASFKRGAKRRSPAGQSL